MLVQPIGQHIFYKFQVQESDPPNQTLKKKAGPGGTNGPKHEINNIILQSSGGRTESGGEGDGVSQHSSPSPLSTPHVSKRKSIHDRKLRPKSVVDSSTTEDYAPGTIYVVRVQFPSSSRLLLWAMLC
jgi:hypothetical protein